VEKEENVEWTSSADKEAIISHMSKAIKDNSLTLSRKDKQVQADNCLTQIALVSWLTSPSGYKRKQASSVEIYPSESTMYQEYARLWCHAGRCPKTYGMYRDQMTELGITQKQVGKVDMDKLKLKSGFFSNFKNGTTTAMAASTGKSKHSLAKEISRLIKREGGFNDSSSNDEGEKSFTDAKYVNIFRLKTVDGYTHNGEYFLSDGTMTGDDLIGQLTLVNIGYESVNVNIYGICLDAGGSNAGAVNSL
jgi:hypothetical protein